MVSENYGKISRRLTRAQIANMLFPLAPCWSLPIEEISLTQAAATIPAALAAWDITVAGLPAGATIVIAKLAFKFGAVENSNAAVNSSTAPPSRGPARFSRSKTILPVHGVTLCTLLMTSLVC